MRSAAAPALGFFCWALKKAAQIGCGLQPYASLHWVSW